jgi:short-subunit dehydrogenase
VTSNLIKTPKVVTIDQNRWSRSVKFTGHDLLEWVVTVDQNTHLPDLLATKGKLLNVASTAAFQPGPYMAVYCATKSFVLSFTEAIACELEDTGVEVTAFCPGPTASGFQEKAELGNSALIKGKKLPTSEYVAKLGYRAMQRGQRVYIPGFINWVMAQSMHFTPRNLATKVVKIMIKPI